MDMTEIIKSCIATVVIIFLGLVFLSMIGELIPGGSGSSKAPASVQVISEQRASPVPPQGRSSAVRVMSLVAGVMGPLTLVYLIVRHLNKCDEAGGDAAEILCAAARLQEKKQHRSLEEGESDRRKRVGSGKPK